MHFEWHDAKAQVNLRLHGVSFDQAKSVFKDTCAIEWRDEREDYGEPRFVMIGMDDDGVLLFVAFTERGDSIRIISTRKATQYEQDEYFRQNAR